MGTPRTNLSSTNQLIFDFEKRNLRSEVGADPEKISDYSSRKKNGRGKFPLGVVNFLHIA